jgi:hypothetical protein
MENLSEMPLAEPTSSLPYRPRLARMDMTLAERVSDVPSVLAFSLPKAGSTLLNDILQLLRPHVGLEFFSISDELFRKNIAVDQYPSVVGDVFHERGYIYGGFRSFPIYPIPILNRARGVFLIRDPRDMLVSLYFSILKSHCVPGESEPGSMSEAMLDARSIANSLDINQHVLLNLSDLHKTFEGYLVQGFHRRRNIAVYRYEDIIHRKRDWIQDLCQWFGWTVSDEALEFILDRVDVIPDEERPDQHIRQVVPGNYLKHLEQSTIEAINRRLKLVMRIFGYQ